MAENDHAKQARAYLEHLCQRMDRGEAPVRSSKAWWQLPSFIPVAVGLSLVACGGTVQEESKGGDTKEICDNGKDDNGDGKIDCDDSDCAEFPGCLSAAYAAPVEKDCRDGLDNDGDGLTDCLDSDCIMAPGCTAPAYAAPVETDCQDGQDNDGDGEVDCDDSDCADVPACTAGPAYAAPVEADCEDGKDNDGDGDIDCADSDCYNDPACMSAAYAAPFSP